MCVCSIGIGAGPAGPVLAGPLFLRFNFIVKIAHALCVHLLKPDHFKNPSYKNPV